MGILHPQPKSSRIALAFKRGLTIIRAPEGDPTPTPRGRSRPAKACLHLSNGAQDETRHPRSPQGSARAIRMRPRAICGIPAHLIAQCLLCLIGIVLTVSHSEHCALVCVNPFRSPAVRYLLWPENHNSPIRLRLLAGRRTDLGRWRDGSRRRRRNRPASFGRALGCWAPGTWQWSVGKLTFNLTQPSKRAGYPVYRARLLLVFELVVERINLDAHP